jgi:hypothetical protein
VCKTRKRAGALLTDVGGLFTASDTTEGEYISSTMSIIWWHRSFAVNDATCNRLTGIEYQQIKSEQRKSGIVTGIAVDEVTGIRNTQGETRMYTMAEGIIRVSGRVDEHRDGSSVSGQMDMSRGRYSSSLEHTQKTAKEVQD